MAQGYHYGNISQGAVTDLASGRALSIRQHSPMAKRPINFVQAWRLYRGLSQDKLAERMSTSKPQISRLESGERRLTVDWLTRLARALDTTPDKMHGPPPSAQDEAALELPIPRLLPLIDTIQAGLWGEVTDPYPKGAGSDYIPIIGTVGPRAFGLRLRGDSMKPQFLENDIIVVDPDVRPWPGCFVVAKLDDTEQATFKRYRVRRDERQREVIDLVPLNPDWPTLTIDAKHRGRIIGVAVDHHRRLF